MRRTGTVVGVLLAIGLSGAVARADFDERYSIETPRLVVTNVIGHIDVHGHDGKAFEVEVAVRGADGTPKNIDVVLEEGREAQLRVVFPLDRYRDYVYPALGHGRVSMSLDDDSSSWLAKLFGGHQLEVTGSGRGLEVWADVTIRVPRGGDLAVHHGIGEMVARKVNGSLELDSGAGRVEVAEIDGPLTVDTGSGEVELEQVHGAKILVDTGSGGVDAKNVGGDAVTIDTGSGSVEVEQVTSKKLRIDTGSGSVRASDIEADDLEVDTGSGSVEVEIVRMGHGRFTIDTGSGGIELHLPADASAAIDAETGSGGVRFDLGDDVRVLRQERDEVRLTLGAGDAEVHLDTGSGSIQISR